MPVRIVLEGVIALRQKYRNFPRQFDAVMLETMKAALLELQGSVPPYPDANPDSTYRRTGMLGKSLGANMQGRKEGAPDIFEVRRQGGSWVGQFGSRVKYAPLVIGETTQARVHRGRWWTIKTLAERAAPKILHRYKQATERLARWLDR